MSESNSGLSNVSVVLDVDEPPGELLDALTELRKIRRAVAKVSNLRAKQTDLPGPPQCFACGAQTLRADVEYEYRYECNDVTQVNIVKHLPGYRCPVCETPYLDPAIDKRFLGMVAGALASGLGDDRLDRALKLERPPRTSGAFAVLPGPKSSSH
jgi:YgiT-type zinc finger domain-containing protein